MNYILRNEKEAERLSKQAGMAPYSVEEELLGMDFPSGASILDAGCGSGALLGYLARQGDSILSGCDLLEEHIEYCRRALPQETQLWQQNLLEGPPKGSYDHIFLRFVAHHLGRTKTEICLGHLASSLKSGGLLTCIDADGILINLGTTNRRLLVYLERLRTRFSGDVEIARKLPSLLVGAGLEVRDCRVQAVHFKDEMREEEAKQFEQRFANGRAGYISMLGSEADFEEFERLFLSQFRRPEIPYYMTKFIVTARKG